MRVVPFVLHEHKARRAGLHFDLRIQYLNKKKLASWAIPKARIPNKRSEKVLAVQTPDHNLSWLSYQGDIVDGTYGAGTMKIVQTGKLEILAWSPRVISFIAHGFPMDGNYALVRFDTKQTDNTWLLVKGKSK